MYRPGRLNGKADVLSRLDQYRPEKGGDEDQPITSVLKNHHFSPPNEGPSFLVSSARLASIPVAPAWNNDFLARVKTAASRDTDYTKDLAVPPKNEHEDHGLLYHNNLLRIPSDPALRKEILESEHDSVVAGHLGMDRTIDLIRRNFWWPAPTPWHLRVAPTNGDSVEAVESDLYGLYYGSSTVLRV